METSPKHSSSISPTGGLAVRSKKRIVPRFIISDNSSEIFCVRFSPDDQYLAASHANGLIKIFSTASGKTAFQLNTGEHAPTTQLRWRPLANAGKTRNVLVSVNSDGQVQHWHMNSGKLLSEIGEKGNQLFCVDYTNDGSLFAVAGRNREVHVYDETTRQVHTTLKGGEFSAAPGHSNRVFSLKFHPTDPNVILSGGWDNTVHVWDIRTGHSVRNIFGPFICGDALDISKDGKRVLTGSWRTSRQLQIWDFDSCELMEDIPWVGGSQAPGFRNRAASAIAATTASQAESCMVYSCQFAKNDYADAIVAGGSGLNETKLFDREANNSPFGTITATAKGFYSVDFSQDATMVAMAGGDGAIRVMNVQR
uniref:Anaphase-promoting complex subunit 4-like WD40 domain-containing protein n=1 Tax=Chromera velia CCMP2878 TaxID=1169474 RepID=A0A0G4HNX9_9ALVE|eukprot:Cvel_7727.t1-p1 / transcript=Cvel_7727.t1 / gene=Cvel_7727 / organism=Chromera_velia_CCMP2878 / gene_product=WD repeat-containing protein 5, putative / transcript_product=WD repeat-containing protein 5, putative / location=Cvel_scaffold411:3633-5306(-) / protein_length=365 / sequence_SO=supercontig / SO=protein_coding / is_pseudo=false